MDLFFLCRIVCTECRELETNGFMISKEPQERKQNECYSFVENSPVSGRGE